MARRTEASVDDIAWEDLRYFLRAAETRSLSAAARRLGVEHTTVGRRLTALEEALGAPLVHRGPAGLTLTHIGEQVLAHAQSIDQTIAAIHATVREHVTVRLVIPTGFTALLTPHLASLQRDEPRLELEIVSGGRRADLPRGEADLALRMGPIDDPDDVLVAKKVGEVGFAAYASRAYLAGRTVDPDELAGERLIAFHQALAAHPAAAWLAERARGATIVMRSREAIDMLEAAKSGAGIAVIPCFLADPDASLVRLTPRPIARREMAIVYRREARVARELRAVITFLVTTLRASARALGGEV